MENSYSYELLTNLGWPFIGERFTSLEEFNNAVRQYKARIDEIGGVVEDDDTYLLDTVVVNASQIKVFHDRWETDDEEAMAEILLSADNGKSFTAGELLFKTHNAFVGQLSDLDHHFFEGFSLVESDIDVAFPCYEVELGS